MIGSAFLCWRSVAPAEATFRAEIRASCMLVKRSARNVSMNEIAA